MADVLTPEQMKQLEDQGLALDRPPETSESEIPSKLESGVRGAAQGLSLGFADELAGILGAGGEAIQNPSKLGDLAELYRKNRDESRELYKKAQEANPVTYGASEVGGGIASMFVPGLNVGKGIKGAAALGGAMGLGASEADLTKGEIAEAAKDVGKGAALGGVVGAAGAAVGKGIGVLRDTEMAAKFAKQLEAGKKGVNAFSHAQKKAADMEAAQFAEQLGLESKQAHTAVGKELGELRKKAPEELNIKDIMDPLEENIKKLANSEDPEAIRDAAKLQEYLDNLKKGVEKKVPVQYQKITLGKTIPAQPGTEEQLAQEAAQAQEQARLTGQPLNTQIVPGTGPQGEDLMSLVKTRGIAGASAKTLPNVPAVPEQIVPSQPGPIVTKMVKSRAGGINPEAVPFGKAEEIKQTLGEFGGTGETPRLSTNQGQGMARQAAGEISNLQKEIPAIKEATQRSHASFQAMDALGLDPAKDFVKDAITGELTLTPDATEKLNHTLMQASKEGSTKADRLSKAFELLGQADPTKAKALQQKAQEIIEKQQTLGNVESIKGLKDLIFKAPSAAGNLVGLSQRELAQKIAASPVLSSLSKAIQSAADSPEAQALSQKLTDLSKETSLFNRVAGLSALLTDPTTRSTIEQQLPDVKKEVVVKTPETSTGGASKAAMNYDRTYDEPKLERMVSRITPKMGSAGQQLKNVLSNIKTKDEQSRRAMMFALEQNPAYRDLLKELR